LRNLAGRRATRRLNPQQFLPISRVYLCSHFVGHDPTPIVNGPRGRPSRVGSAEMSLRARRARIRRGNQMTPGDQLRRAVVAIDDTFDQRRPLAVRKRDLDGFGELAPVLGAQAAAMTVLGV